MLKKIMSALNDERWLGGITGQKPSKYLLLSNFENLSKALREG